MVKHADETAATYPQLLWSGQTTNSKTDNIPTLHVGATYEETRASCAGCPLLERVCYSHNGTPRMGLAAIHRSVEKRGVQRYSFERAMQLRLARARYVRATSIGDAARANPVELREQHDKVRALGLGWLAYTHFPDDALAKGIADLFCVSLEHIDVARRSGQQELLDEGWDVLERVDHWLDNGFTRVTAAMPDSMAGDTAVTPSGRVGRWCPAQRTKNEVTCNQCGWCDPQAPGPDWVIFKDHGPAARGRARRK